MKRLLQRVKCLFGIHSRTIVKRTGYLKMFNERGLVDKKEVVYRACAACGKTISWDGL